MEFWRFKLTLKKPNFFAEPRRCFLCFHLVHLKQIALVSCEINESESKTRTKTAEKPGFSYVIVTSQLQVFAGVDAMMVHG